MISLRAAATDSSAAAVGGATTAGVPTLPLGAEVTGAGSLLSPVDTVKKILRCSVFQDSDESLLCHILGTILTASVPNRQLMKTADLASFLGATMGKRALFISHENFGS